MILTTAQRARGAWYLSHLSSWYLYIAGAFFMASNWDLFSASLGALSLPHCWLFSTLEQQTSANPKSAMLPCVPPLEIRQIKALHASVASSKCQWPTSYLHDQLHQKSPIWTIFHGCATQSTMHGSCLFSISKGFLMFHSYLQNCKTWPYKINTLTTIHHWSEQILSRGKEGEYSSVVEFLFRPSSLARWCK